MGTKGRKIKMDEAQELSYKISRGMINDILASQYKGEFSVHVLGSVARNNADEVGDIDILIVLDEGHGLNEIKSYLFTDEDYLLSAGDRVIHALIMDDVQVDVYMCHPDEYPCMYNYLAGPSSANIRMRSRAKKLGLKLNQYDLVDAKTGITVLTRDSKKYFRDAEIYKILGLEYKEVWNR